MKTLLASLLATVFALAAVSAFAASAVGSPSFGAAPHASAPADEDKDKDKDKDGGKKSD